ncbi:MAG: aliphatic sulfonate ABC transporter substrate-binding protein [Campylobacteraceae bacterium]|jgi:sulfonate transport system substrate-binding protein|nr:aliphatic sulfonate ABC transporter substrate-binding protein [Campylobacteraceae bacterium]
MKNKTVLALTMLLAALIFGGCSDNKPKDKTTLRIGAMNYPLFASIPLAHRLGYLKEELDKVNAVYTWTIFASGPLINEAAASGNIDIGFMADVPAIIAKSTGQDIEIFANVANGEKALALVVKKNSPYTKIEDLKNKKIAYVKGSYAQHLLAILLNNAGLTFGDIISVNLGAGDIPLALEKEQIDAAVVWEQFITFLTNSGKATVIADGTNVKKGNLVSYVTKKYADANPKVITAYIKAAQRASEYIKMHPKEAAEAIAKDVGIEADLLVKIFKNLDFDQRLTDDDINEIRKVKDYILNEKIIQNDVDIDSFVTTKYIKKAGL